MFKKRHSQPQISPLPSPAATQPYSQQIQRSQSQSQIPNSNSRMSMGPPPTPQPYRQGSNHTLDYQQQAPQSLNQSSVRSRNSVQQGGIDEMGFQAGPQYSGNHGAPVERVMSESQRSKAPSEKSEKRRSGLFGFGRKKEDKEREKREREERERMDRQREDRPARHSFNVNRADTNFQQPGQSFPPPQSQSQSQHDNQSNDYPHQMHRFPTPQGSTPPLPQSQVGQNRITSNPSPRPGGNVSDFGPSAGDRMSKSQSMGFSQQGTGQGRVPETHPYRGYLAGHPEGDESGQAPSHTYGQGKPQGLPKSMSMPLDKATPPTPPRETVGLQPQSSSPQIRPADLQNRDRAVSTGSVTSATGAGTGRPTGTGVGQPEWMREFTGIVELIGMQPQKTYVASPPELEMIMARTSAGGQPKQGQPGSASNDWDAVWLQLSGISLSMWSMKETRAAAAKGEKVPPTYFNITDSSLELLAPLPPPPHRPNSHPHHFVFSLNTAGSNRLLFSCPSEQDIARWSTGLRLAAWERARLEEIYTGHLIKSGGKEPRVELNKGRMEGWVRVRIMGGTEWKRLWAVLSTPNPPPVPPEQVEEEKKGRRKSFFGMGGGGGASGSGGKDEEQVIQEPNTGVPMASFYAEQRTAKNRTMAPVLTISSVTQAYAVFPERLEVISQSNLMKVVGRIGGELVAIEGRLRESGWALIMPDTPDAASATPPIPTPLVNMMKWVTAVHDVFGLYGRPGRYSWDEKDPKSLFFAYPKGTERNRLFLELDDALVSDYRLSNLPQIRSKFIGILGKKGQQSVPSASAPARSPSTRQDKIYDEDNNDRPAIPQREEADYRLPPLSFDQSSGRGGVGANGNSPHMSISDHSIPRSLSPITERTDTASRNNSQRTNNTERQFSGSSSLKQGQQQGGRGSSKYQQQQQVGAGMEQGSQLETISDADTFGGQMTDGPRMKSPSGIQSPDSSMVGSPSPGVSMATTAGMGQAQNQNQASRSGTFESQTGESIYSQSTGVTPTPARSLAASPSNNHGTVVPAPLPVPELPAGSDSEFSPGSRENDNSTVPAPIPVPATGQAGSTMFSPVLAAPISQSTTSPSAPANDSERSIHSPTPRRVASTEFKADKLMLHEEPAAQYLMNVVEEPHPTSPASQPVSLGSATEQEKPRPTIITDFSPKPATAALAATKQNESLGRKPSGARAPPPKKPSGVISRLGSVDDASPPPPPLPIPGHSHDRSGTFDIDEDAQAYLAYADQPASATVASQPEAPQAKSEEEVQRSSFAPSKAVAERRAKAEAAAVESQRAKALPGGGKRTGGNKQTWSDEDEDEDEDEQPDDSPVVETSRTVPAVSRPDPVVVTSQTPASGTDYFGSGSGSIGRAGLRALPPVPQVQENQAPQYPSDSAQNGYDLPHPSFPDRPRSRSPAQQGNRMSQAQAPYPNPSAAPPAARQNIWNANFAAGHGMPEPTKSGKFVELEEPQTKLTQAFAPHGLLQAGMQDKEDRSAKKQEELARELGSSLINVPSKPPPPSAGLLGAVAQHEKERKNAGGIGATLTDREREKRVAEERQREIEKLQRQQADHMRQFGDFGQGGQQGYGGGGGGYGMGMQMSMGMPMGFNVSAADRSMDQKVLKDQPYQGGYNPYAQQQAMFAAQMAYQNAMMMSAAGSQAGGGQNGTMSPDRPASPIGGGGSQFNFGVGGGGGGGNGTQSPFPQMQYGWPGAMPWMPPAPGSPGMPGMMGMPSFPSMPSFNHGHGGEYLYPGGSGGQQGPGSGHGTPFDRRSRVDSFHTGGGAGASGSRARSEDRNGAPAN